MTSRMIAVMPDWPAKSMSWRDAPSDDTVFCQMRRRDDDGERANGYSYDAVKIFMPAGAKKPVYAPYREHVPPDTTAAIFWLKNRDPAHWRDAWQLERYMCAYG
jgi:hypothetical protein